MPKLTFLGAVGTVTGSKYLVEAEGRRILIDCGLFQGYKQLRLRNWAKLPVEPSSIDAVLLTHAHIDHSGCLPLLVKEGFRGPVICSYGALHAAGPARIVTANTIHHETNEINVTLLLVNGVRDLN